MSSSIKFEFVKYIPEALESGVLYISLEYATAVHMCCCGCGNKVVTPISVTDWKMIFYGDSISLYPSIGNWSFECRSHYWIDKNDIIWADSWSDEEIEENRSDDACLKNKYFTRRKYKRSVFSGFRSVFSRFL